VRHDPAFQISVNVSPVQLQREGINHESWLGCLESMQLPGQGMVMEITEGMLMDSSRGVSSQLLRFRDNGVQAALDDFGTGYSSLSYLKKFDIDYIKIDKSFVQNLAPGSDDMALCDAIIVMAHKLGIKVVAEGVETEGQRRLLAASKCDYAQGYLFSRPVPAEEFEQLF
jgi:EAL domain-containing protein (putative c-di-GMP-specific phosphodiesterase class I)